MLELNGRSVSKGIAIGKLSFYSNNQNVPKYEVADTDLELKRYKNSLEMAKTYLQSLYLEACKRVSENESVIFKTHIMILEDSKFVEMVQHYIKNKRLNAEFAVHSTACQLAEIFRQLDDDYLQQRYSDILDAANTLLKILRPKSDMEEDKQSDDNEPVIIAASELLPSETISFKKESLLGFITNNGSKNSHTAILARTMGLPAVTHIEEPLDNFDGMLAIIDGQKGKIIINPDTNTIALYQARKNRYNREQLTLKRQIGLPPVTKNGQSVKLSAVISDLDDVSSVQNTDSDGVGLFKSESAFINRKKPPSENELFEAYKKLIKTFNTSYVNICIANLSSGKGIEYLDLPKEKNPAIGYKGIRVSLSNPELFKSQLKALYRASVFGRLKILLPMINSVDEVDYVKRTIKEVKSELRVNAQPYNSNVQIGIIIETPASAIISDELSKMVDFVMIDTDSLTQYTLAIDPHNAKLEYLYEPYHKSVLRLIRFVAEHVHQNNKTVALCGELACDTHMTSLFLALKIDELVVVPSKILSVKAAVRETDTSDCSKVLSKL